MFLSGIDDIIMVYSKSLQLSVVKSGKIRFSKCFQCLYNYEIKYIILIFMIILECK